MCISKEFGVNRKDLPLISKNLLGQSPNTFSTNFLNLTPLCFPFTSYRLPSNFVSVCLCLLRRRLSV